MADNEIRVIGVQVEGDAGAKVFFSFDGEVFDEAHWIEIDHEHPLEVPFSARAVKVESKDRRSGIRFVIVAWA